jgi:hypothetical protein
MWKLEEVTAENGRATTVRELEAGGQASEEDIKTMGRRFSGRRGGRTKIIS